MSFHKDMITLFFFAFLAGLFTALSPCVLPVLPAILSSATGKEKLRPLGTVLGLVISFSFFTLALSSIVEATGISSSTLRYVAIVLIFLFGLVMIFEGLSNWFARMTSFVAGWGQRLQGKKAPKGFWSGTVFGVALGLLWTPCAGPILAAITTLVATHGVTGMAVAMTFIYGIGAGIPMLLLAYGGKKLIESSRLLSRYTERIRQFFGFLMILFAVVLSLNWDMLLQEKLAKVTPQFFTESSKTLDVQLKTVTGPNLVNGGVAPNFEGISEWINTAPLSMEQLRGKVILVDFWTYSCINCLRTIPHVKSWYDDYKKYGFVVVGVHTPEFEFEKNLANVTEAVHSLGITYPVGLDNQYKTWQAYHNSYWPAHYLIDQAGNIRMIHVGEGGYAETENAIRELLGMSPINLRESAQNSLPITPETYLGSKRGNVLISSTPGPDEVGLLGPWKIKSEFIEAEGVGCSLYLNFEAKQVYLVLSGESDHPIEVYLDGKAVGKIKVHEARKYDVVNTSYGRHQLRLDVPQGIQAYSFTFGNE